jgi:hypothetical protein
VSVFTSFKPKKFATKRDNNYCNKQKFGKIRNDELCSICGYPSGKHHGITGFCPTKEIMIIYNVIPYGQSKPKS